MLLGLADGTVLKIYVDNAFPVDVWKGACRGVFSHEHTCHAGEAAVKLLDRTGDRRKLAVVNESNELKVVDTRSKELVFSARTRRPFLMNELQRWDEGVMTPSS